MTELAELNSFIKILHDEMGFDFDAGNFKDRFRLQKFVFLAKYFGWDNSYSYNIYLRGPYSKELADHYYSFQKIENNTIPIVPLKSFHKNEFFTLIKNKYNYWFEAASTIISLMENYKHSFHGNNLKIKVLTRVKELKDDIPEETINSAYNDLLTSGIIPKIIEA
jgi:hypothetical protein